MVDIFALALSHGLIALALWRLIQRGDLDADKVGDGSPGSGPAPRAARRRGKA